MSEYSNIFVIQKGRKETRVRLYENSWAFAKMLAYPLMEMSYKYNCLSSVCHTEEDFFKYATINTECNSWVEVGLSTEEQRGIAENDNADYLRRFIDEHCTNHCGALVIWVSEKFNTYGNTVYVDGWKLECAFMAGREDVYCNRNAHLSEEEAEKELHRFLVGIEYFAYYPKYCGPDWRAIWRRWCEFFDIRSRW